MIYYVNILLAPQIRLMVFIFFMEVKYWIQFLIGLIWMTSGLLVL